MPYLVETVVPSTSGSRSRCTPWRETSAPAISPRLAILSISSRNTMPFCSALASALAFSSSSFTRRAASSSVSCCIASRMRSFLSFLPPPERFWNMPWICEVSSSMPGGARISICAGAADSSSSISLSPSSPSRSFFLNFCRVLRARAHGAHRALARLLDADLHQVAHDGVDVAPDVADLGELGRLDLDEGRVCQARQAPRDLGLAHAGGTDHEDVLRSDLLAQRLAHLLAAPAVPERDRHRALCAVLPDDVLVQLVHDLLRRHLRHSSTSMTLRWLV